MPGERSRCARDDKGGARYDNEGRPKTAVLPLLGAGLRPAYHTLPSSPGLVMAPWLAEATLRTYLAKTPVV